MICNGQHLNITMGTDVVLHDTLIFDGETFDPALSVGIAANLVSSLGKRTALEVEVADGALIIYVPWVERNAGYYGLEVTGTCNSKKWATYADSLIHYTRATEMGVAEVTIESDYYDITQVVGYRYSTSPIKSVTASVDDQVGTPGVDTDYDGKNLSFAFHNMKGNRGNGIASSSEVLSPDDGGTNTHTFTDDDGNEHTFHTKNGRKGDQGDSAIWTGEGEPWSGLKNTTGQSTTEPMSQKAVTDAIITQGDNSFDLESAGLSVSNTTYLGINKRNYGVQVYVNKAYNSGSYFGYIEMELEEGKRYMLSFDYYSELPGSMTPSMRNSSKAYIDGFKDENDNYYSIPTGSGHAEWTFTAPSGVEYMGLLMEHPLAKLKALWIENITLVCADSIVTEAFSDFRDKSTEADATLKAEVDDAKYAMSPVIIGTVAEEDGGLYPIKTEDGNVNRNVSDYKHTEYFRTNGAKKIAVLVPNIGSQSYGLAFYYRRSYATFISSVPFSDGSKKYTAGWKIIDVPDGATFFRYTIRPDDEIKYRIVTSTADLLQVYNDSAADMIATQIMRSAKVVSDKNNIFTFPVVKMDIVNNKAYVAYFVSETQLNVDVAGHGGDYVCSEIDILDCSTRIFDVVTESTKYSDGSTASPTWLDYSTTTVTPDGQIADFALMGFGNNNPIYIYAIYDAATRARNFNGCRLVYTPSGGTEHDVEFSVNTYRQMLYDMGYANSYVQSSMQYVDNITLGYNADEEVYYAVMCTSQNTGKAVLPIMLMVSEDMATWSPAAKIGESDAGEISAIYKDGKVYAAYRTFNNGMRWVVYDIENQQTVSEGQFPVSKGAQGLASKPNTFTFNGDVYMAVNIDPEVFGPNNNYTDYSLIARQQIAMYKVVDGVPKFFRKVNNPTGINYFSFCEAESSISGQGTVYIAFCEDRRHLYRRQFANVSFADMTALFVNNGRII